MTTADRAPFENGKDQTIRQLVERIDNMTRGATGTGAAYLETINDYARRALTIMDRLTSNESAWIDKYHEAKSLGFSDGDAEAHADHAVARLP